MTTAPRAGSSRARNQKERLSWNFRRAPFVLHSMDQRSPLRIVIEARAPGGAWSYSFHCLPLPVKVPGR
ncbi:hypothetical protein B0F90DRAFT_1752645, partial [Multifurca ochricompacta]